jgi:hypothetical protein
MAKSPAVLPVPGPVDIGGTRFPLSQNTTLDYVHGVHRLVFGADSFFVVLYGAQNACGLIATEHNGIAVIWENKGKVVLLDHSRASSYMQPSGYQKTEFARICALDATGFKAFINGHPGVECKVLVAKPKPILKPRLPWKTAEFTGDKWTSAEDKLKFLVALVNFLCHHCDRDRFTRRIYDGLHQYLSHIAHYNMAGFYDEWFADLPNRIRFLIHRSAGTTGPVCSWHDVDMALRDWIRGPEGQTVLKYYQEQLRAETEAAERAELARLQKKYEPAVSERGS